MTDQIADIVVSMAKTIKAMQMYGSEHPSANNFFKPFFQKLTTMLECQPELSLRIEQYAIFYDRSKVYEEREKDISIAFRLFRDGVRKITLSQGITSEEIKGFLESISKTSRNQDIALSLWEHHFPNIDFYVVEEEDKDYVYKPPEEPARDIDFIAKFDEIINREKIDINTPFDPNLTSQELEELKKQISHGFPVMTAAITTMMEMLEYERSPVIIDSLIKLLEQCLVNANFYDARRIVHRLRQYPDIDPMEKFENEGTIINFTTTVNTESDSVFNEFLAFIGLFSARTIPYLLRLLSDVKRLERLQALRHRVAYIAQENPAAVISLLGSSNLQILINAIAIIGLLRLQDAMAYLKPLFVCPNPKVRSEVVSALENTDNPFYITTFLDDEDIGVRIRCLQALGRLRYLKIYNTLLRRIKTKSFRQLEFLEQREYFNCLVSNGGKTLIKDLKKILFKCVLFSGKKYAVMRKMAALAIAQVGNLEARTLLINGMKKRNKDIQQACGMALKQL